VEKAVLIDICVGAVDRVMYGLFAYEPDIAVVPYLLLYTTPCEVQYVLALAALEYNAFPFSDIVHFTLNVRPEEYTRPQ
jgi:hypothetical protein